VWFIENQISRERKRKTATLHSVLTFWLYCVTVWLYVCGLGFLFEFEFYGLFRVPFWVLILGYCLGYCFDSSLIHKRIMVLCFCKLFIFIV